MALTEERRGAVKVVGLSGRLDAVTSPDVEKQLLAMVDQGDVRIALDLAGLTYVSSFGLRALIALAKHVQAKGGKLALASLGSSVREIFQIAGFTKLFSIHADTDGAVAYCAD